MADVKIKWTPPSKPDNFVSLHTHSDSSLLDGYSTIPEYIKAAAELGQPAVAITDHGSLGNIYNLQKYSDQIGNAVKAIAGIEFYVVPSIGTIDSKEPLYLGTYGPNELPTRDDVSGRGAYTHMTAIAENTTGLRNLFKLNAIANDRGYYMKPRVSLELLAEYSEGIIVTTGCPSGEVQTRIRLGDYDGALAFASKLVDIFGRDSVFVELMDHGMGQDLERKVKPSLLQIAETLKLGLVATTDAHYALASDAPTHEQMLAIQTHSVMSEKPDFEGGRRFAFEGGTYYLRSAAEMTETFKEHPSAVTNTLVIAERSGFRLEHDPNLIPAWPIPEGYTEETYLRKEARDGLARRLPDKANDPEYLDRIEHELRVLVPKNFVSYFFIVSDFMRWAKFRAEPPVPTGYGRGSGAGSLIAFCLDITDPDPIKFDLLFERFVHDKRDNFPDFDTDFGPTDRARVIDYVRQKYGEEYVSGIATFGAIKAKNAIKDVARIYEEPFEVGNKLTKALPAPIFGREVSLAEVYDPEAERYPEAREFRELVEAEGYQKLVDSARRLEGRTRSMGQHAAAILVSKEPISSVVPMRRAKEDLFTTEFDYPTSEALGLLKIDFLGLRNLEIIRDCLAFIEKGGKPPVDIQAILQGDLADLGVYKLLQDADTKGIFQMDGGGLQGLLKIMRPTEFEDISAVLALYRPGPLALGSHTAYADRKNQREEIPSMIHTEFNEVLEPVLGKTFGLILYQEQVMQAAQLVAGYSLAEADNLRRAMGKKDRAKLDKEFVRFEAGSLENGYSPDAIQTLWNVLVPFADYGFNRCLTGDAEVLIKTETGGVVPMRIEQLWAAHQERNVDGRGIKVYAFDPERNNFYFDHLRAVMHNGVKDVYRVTTADGRQITATADHRHMTARGMREVRQLRVGDELITVPFTDDKIDIYNALKMWSGPREAHLDTIVDIEHMGSEETYDLEMYSVFHNFVANGVVTHNSHSVAYGMISYMTAYLKVHYTAEYMAALLESVKDDTDKTAEYLEDCRQHGIQVTQPDLNKSGVTYLPVNDKVIAFGFGAIKGVGAKVAEELVDWREANGEFTSFHHFLQAAPKNAVNKRIIEALALGGGFDTLPAKSGLDPATGKPYKPYSRNAIYSGVEAVLKDMSKARTKIATAARRVIRDAEKAQNEARELAQLQQIHPDDVTPDQVKRMKTIERAMARRAAAAAPKAALFDIDEVTDVAATEQAIESEELEAPPNPEDDIIIEALEEWAKLEKLKLERTVLGLYVSGHPLDELNMEGMASQRIGDMNFTGEGEDRVEPRVTPLEGWPDRNAKPHRIAGIVTQLAHRRTKKGDSMATGVIEDRTGAIPFTVFPKTYSGDPFKGKPGYGELLKLDGVYQLTGFSRLRDEEVSFNVDSLRPLEFGMSGALSVRVKLTTGQWERGRPMLESIFKQFPAREGARTNVIVSLKAFDGKITEEVLDAQVNPSPALTQRIREVFGMLAIGRWRSAR